VERRPIVLFVCVYDTARTQMAAGFLRSIMGGEIDAFSAGIEPAELVDPHVVQAMAEAGIDIAFEKPKLLRKGALGLADLVITMGCRDAVPAYPGKRYEDWQLADPSGRPIEEVRTIRDEIKARVEALASELQVPQS
jgi:protein-tyrosine-phosphatase